MIDLDLLHKTIWKTSVHLYEKTEKAKSFIHRCQAEGVSSVNNTYLQLQEIYTSLSHYALMHPSQHLTQVLEALDISVAQHVTQAEACLRSSDVDVLHQALRILRVNTIIQTADKVLRKHTQDQQGVTSSSCRAHEEGMQASIMASDHPLPVMSKERLTQPYMKIDPSSPSLSCGISLGRGGSC